MSTLAETHKIADAARSEHQSARMSNEQYREAMKHMAASRDIAGSAPKSKRKRMDVECGALSTGWGALCMEICKQDFRKLNWRAMKYFIRRKMYAEASICRERVIRWDNKGPV